MFTTQRIAIFFAAAYAFALTGCESVPYSVAAKPAPQQGRAAVDTRQAEALERQGDFTRAAQEYARLAESVDVSVRAEYQLRAAALWLRAGEPDRAQTVLAAVSVARLDAGQSARKRLLDARIALALRVPQQALNALQAPLSAHGPAMQAEAELLRAEAHDMAGNHLEAARERVLRESLLSESIAIEDNQRAILHSLGQLSDNALQELRTSADALSGWMELLFIARNISAADAPRQIADWRMRYAGHPAREPVIAALFANPPRPSASAPAQISPVNGAPFGASQGKSFGFAQGRRIALLLPLSGNLAGAGGALRDAFLSAAHADSAADPQVRVYDVAAAQTDTLTVYQQAVQDGAQFIVGPLDKEDVRALFSLASVPVPTLALNAVENTGGAPANLYQFGLLPEDEAQQAAERAWFEGKRQAPLLIPQGEWGERMRQAFSARFQELGGRVVDSQSYAPGDTDFREPVQRLLQFRETPKELLARNSRLPPEKKLPKATRREDADMIFLAAQPPAARQLRPLLQFYYADDLPVYSTSHLYGARSDPDLDQDLDGVIFGDMPWVLLEAAGRQALRAALMGQAPAAFAQYTRLYAMGVDAYHLLADLERLRQSSDERFAGETGILSMDGAGRLHRRLVWARFAGGEAQFLEAAAGVALPAP
ncbi:MAG: penicillin-binding protein activator [Gammaproteobacteria bacterium]